MGFKNLRTGSLLYCTYKQQVRSFPSKTNYLIISTKLSYMLCSANHTSVEIRALFYVTILQITKHVVFNQL